MSVTYEISPRLRKACADDYKAYRQMLVSKDAFLVKGQTFEYIYHVIHHHGIKTLYILAFAGSVADGYGEIVRLGRAKGCANVMVSETRPAMIRLMGQYGFAPVITIMQTPIPRLEN